MHRKVSESYKQCNYGIKNNKLTLLQTAKNCQCIEVQVHKKIQIQRAEKI